MLEAHCLARNHTASTKDIASAVGKQWRATNLHYGLLGANLRRAMGKPDVGRGEQQSTILAFFEHPNRRFQLTQWVMHTSLATAIQGLGWFAGEDIGTE
jgi:hypothetical protein